MARDQDLTAPAAILVDAARQHGERTEQLRQQMLTAAAERAGTIYQLHTEHGLSIRQIAGLLGVSAPTIQSAIARGRDSSRPGIG